MNIRGVPMSALLQLIQQYNYSPFERLLSSLVVLLPGTWTWITVSCTVVLLVLIPLTAWSVHYYRLVPISPIKITLLCMFTIQSCYSFGLLFAQRTKMLSNRSCWPSSKQDRTSVGLPATKQDATEVQWDLSWMEMSNLLDRHVYPST